MSLWSRVLSKTTTEAHYYDFINFDNTQLGLAIADVVKSIVSLSADQIRDVVARQVKEWCEGMSLYDDLTFVVMKAK